MFRLRYATLNMTLIVILSEVSAANAVEESVSWYNK